MSVLILLFDRGANNAGDGGCDKFDTAKDD